VTEKPVKATAGDVRAALRLRFAAPAWAVFDEVGNGTGARRYRHADMVAVSLWPSRGLELHGVEIKVSRSDWLNELKDPAKADEIQKFCDRWWIAVGDAAIVRDGELPPTWGLLVLSKGKTTCKVEAPKLTPEPLSITFVAALLRRASEAADRLRQAGFSEGYTKGLASAPKEGQQEIHSLETKLKYLHGTVAAFEEASGVKIEKAWQAGDIGAAVKRVMEVAGRWHNDADPTAAIDAAAKHLEKTAAILRAGAAKEKQLADIVSELSPEQVEALSAEARAEVA
jgi:hypothetical protein